MGHKGVSKRKLPKAKLKPLSTANHIGGSVTDLAQSGRGLRQLPDMSSSFPFGNDGMNSASGSKKPHKKH